jgi:hypothetical protein
MYQHAHDLGVSWRLGVLALLSVIIEGCEQAVMRQPPPSTTQPLFGRRHVTPRSACWDEANRKRDISEYFLLDAANKG